MSDAIRIGIDVGGTNTDAVLMSGQEILGSCKTNTTKDITTGVSNAVKSVLQQSAVSAVEIQSVMIGTTHFLNAFVQRRELEPVAVIRIALPMGDWIPPLSGWPEDLLDRIGSHIYMIGGGSYFDGREYAELDEQALRDAARDISEKGIRSVAVSSVFALIRPDIEKRAAEILREHIPNVRLTLSHDVGGMGLIERENAAIINAALQELSDKVVNAFRQTVQDIDMSADLYFSQNDGTLVDAEHVRQFPVVTCSAGPTNSLRGAAFLSGLQDAIVVDIGGTTSDLGVLLKGFPRETSAASDVGGVRTNFSMPDVLSVALGGGTRVRMQDGTVKLGPDSVGYLLLQEGLTFGGDTLTLSDIAVVDGRLAIGDPALAAHIGEPVRQQVRDAIRSCLEDAIDQMKTNAADIPVILVGGGSVLVEGDLAGCSKVTIPRYAEVANAIGAAIAQVGGRFKGMVDYGMEGGRDAALEQAVEAAKQHACESGAKPGTVTVMEIEEYPMTHMQTSTVEVRVRVVGDL